MSQLLIVHKEKAHLSFSSIEKNQMNKVGKHTIVPEENENLIMLDNFLPPLPQIVMSAG